jgi:predicted phosphoribosyltransferase
VLVREPGIEESGLVSRTGFDEVVRNEMRELHRREQAYRGDRGPLNLAGRTVVLVDDGAATGATLIAAIRAARLAGARRVIAAAPVASADAVARIDAEADETLFLNIPPYLTSIGEWYDDFHQVDDAEVLALLREATLPPASTLAPVRRRRR